MNLEKYLEEVGISISEFARRIDVSNATIYNILSHKADVRLSTAIRIEDTTKGQVTCRELLSEESLKHLDRNLASQKSSNKKKDKNKK
jgi:predicted transcriptional regulator